MEYNMRKHLKALAAAGITVALGMSCVACGSSSTASDSSKDSSTEQTAAEETTVQAEGTYVTVDWLKENLNNVYVVDARSVSAYTSSHIPGAVSGNWNNLSNVTVAEGEKGWAAVNDAQANLSALALEGLTNDRPIVVYTNVNDGWGEDGRTMWTLQQAGFTDVHILDGGWGAWIGAKGETEGVITGYAESATDIKSVSTAYVKKVVKAGKAVIVDARAEAEYNGTTNMGEAKMGHIPGAVNIPNVSLFEQDGKLKSSEDLEAIFAEAGLTDKSAEVITYCTGGVRAANVAQILHDNGFTNVKVYTCSFAEWAGLGNKVEK